MSSHFAGYLLTPFGKHSGQGYCGLLKLDPLCTWGVLCQALRLSRWTCSFGVSHSLRMKQSDHFLSDSQQICEVTATRFVLLSEPFLCVFLGGQSRQLCLLNSHIRLPQVRRRRGGSLCFWLRSLLRTLDMLSTIAFRARCERTRFHFESDGGSCDVRFLTQ